MVTSNNFEPTPDDPENEADKNEMQLLDHLICLFVIAVLIISLFK